MHRHCSVAECHVAGTITRSSAPTRRRAVNARLTRPNTSPRVSRRTCRLHCAGSAPSWRDRRPPVPRGRSVPGGPPRSNVEISAPRPSLGRSVPGERPFTQRSAEETWAPPPSPAAARRRRPPRFPPRPSTPASSPRMPPSRLSPHVACRTRWRAPAWRSGSCGSGCGSDSRLS